MLLKKTKASSNHEDYPKKLRQLDWLAKLMDSQFRIPGTDIRFGLDAIIGLIPGAGDLTTFGVSGYMILVMARNGAGGLVLTRMVMNILIDAIVGAIPILGDIFDVAFKANMRNMRLMHTYYKPGRQRKNAWVMIIPVLILIFLLIIGLIWVVYKMLIFIYETIF